MVRVGSIGRQQKKAHDTPLSIITKKVENKIL